MLPKVLKKLSKPDYLESIGQWGVGVNSGTWNSAKGQFSTEPTEQSLALF